MTHRDLTDDECDPDLLRVGIRAPKLSQAQRKQNRTIKHQGGGAIAKPNFQRTANGSNKKRRQYFTDNYERIARLPGSRGWMTRK